MIQGAGWGGGQLVWCEPIPRIFEIVVAAVMAGATVRSAVERFGVSVASAVKWSQRYRATGSAAAKPQGGKKPYVLVGQREWLLARIAEAPDLTLWAVMAQLADRGVSAEGAIDPVAAQRGQDGHGLPVAMRDLVDQALAAGAAPVGSGHVGLRPGLVDEDQPAAVKPRLVTATW